MTDYGTDFSCVEDIGPNLSTVTGPIVVVQAVVRRLQTPRGKLWYAPDYGTDIRAYLNGARSRYGIARAIENEALKDARVSDAQADVTLTQSSMTVRLELTLADGPFELVLAVDAVNVEILGFTQAS